MAGTLKVGTITTPSGSGTITIPSGVTLSGGGLATTPFFSVKKSGDTSISNSTNTKITYDTEIVDTDSAFSSNRFTVPSGKDGNYYIQSQMNAYGGSAFTLGSVQLILYKNGSSVTSVYHDPYTNNQTQDGSFSFHHVLSLVAGDYIEMYAYIVSTNGSSPVINGGSRQTIFTGYRILT